MHLLAVEQQLPLVGDVGAGEALDQRRFPGSVVADHGEHLTGMQLQAHAVEADHPAERLHEALGLEHGNPGRGGCRLDGVFDEAHLRTFLIHWSTATATMTRMPIASV